MYEVTLRLERTLAPEYLHWLRAHIDEMLALPGFTSAELFDVEIAEAAKSVEFVVQYRLADHAALQHYFHHHAPSMRAQGIARFGDRVSARRRILRPLSDG